MKPDGVERGLAGEIVGRLERKKLRLVAAELRTITKEVAETHYAEHRERPFFSDLVDVHHAVAVADHGGRGARRTPTPWCA